MTVSTTTSRINYSGNGAVATYSFPFEIFASTDLLVYQAGTLLVLTTNYTVTVATYPGSGSITLTAGNLGNGIALSIVRNVPQTQALDLVDNDSFPAQSVENSLDKETILSQQLQEQLNRAILLKVSSILTGKTIDDPVASAYLRWKSDSSGIEAVTLNTTTGIGTSAIDLIESTPPSGVAGHDIIFADSSHRLKMINNNGTADSVLGAATTDTLTNKTLTSPVINGTPTGTGIQTTIIKKGSGGGTYSTASVSPVDVDATNLSYTVTIPVGWVLEARATGVGGNATAAIGFNVSIFDSVAATDLDGQALIPPVAGVATTAFSLQTVIVGDGASHTVKLRYATNNVADVAEIQNGSAPFQAKMIFKLQPSS